MSDVPGFQPIDVHGYQPSSVGGSGVVSVTNVGYDVPGYNPMAVHGYQPASTGTSSTSIKVLALPQYDLAYTGDTTAFAVGDQPALMWSLTEQGGGNVPAPSGGTLTMARPDGSVDQATTLFVSAAGGLPSISISQTYLFAQRGIYTAELQLTLDIGDGHPQTRSSTVLINVS